MSMQEAFRRAARENPRSNLAHEVFDTVRTQRDKRHGNNIVRLIGGFRLLGTRWRNTRMLGLMVSAEDSLPALREEWVSLLNIRKQQVRNQGEGEWLLGGMIDGMGLNTDPALSFNFERRQVEWPPKELSLSVGSRIFVYSVYDLSRPNLDVERFYQHLSGGFSSTRSDFGYDLSVVLPIVNSWLDIKDRLPKP